MKKININIAANETYLDVNSIDIYFDNETINMLKKQSLVFNDYPNIESINLGDVLNTTWLYDGNETNVKLEYENLVISKRGDMFVQVSTKYTGDTLESELFNIKNLLNEME